MQLQRRHRSRNFADEGSCKAAGIETVWDRSDANTMCKFGAEGLCCKNCNLGPCRISVRAPRGMCGADADTIAARNLSRSVAAGTSAHSDHGRHLVHTLRMVAEGKTDSYKITDERKLLETARVYKIETDGRSASTLHESWPMSWRRSLPTAPSR